MSARIVISLLLLSAFPQLWGNTEDRVSARPRNAFDGGTGLKAFLQGVLKGPDIDYTDSKIREADARISRAYDSYIPNVLFTNRYNLKDSRGRGAIVADVNLYNRGEDIQGIRIARSEERIAELSREAKVLEMAKRATSLYMELVLNRQQRQYLVSDRDRLDAVRERGEKLLKYQAISKLQIYRLERDAFSLSQDIMNLEQNFSDATRELKDLMADSDMPEVLDSLGKSASVNFSATEAEALAQKAIEFSPDLRVLVEREAQMGARKWLALADQMPRLYMTGGYGDFRTAGNTKFSAETFGSINLDVPLLIFDAPFAMGPILRINAEQRSQYRVLHEKTRRDLVREVADRLHSFRIGRRQTELGRKVLASAQGEIRSDESLYLSGRLESSLFISNRFQLRKLVLDTKRFEAQALEQFIILSLMSGRPVGELPSI